MRLRVNSAFFSKATARMFTRLLTRCPGAPCAAWQFGLRRGPPFANASRTHPAMLLQPIQLGQLCRACR
eukprot:1705022-Lingulodinium_polyedra.AAC.1